MTGFVTDAGVEVPAVTEAQMRELDRPFLFDRRFHVPLRLLSASAP